MNVSVHYSPYNREKSLDHDAAVARFEKRANLGTLNKVAPEI